MKGKESFYLWYCDANNLYGWTLSQTLLVANFEWKRNISKFDEKFIKNYDKKNDKEYIFEIDVEYPKDPHKPHNDSLFLPERMKIQKCCKPVCNLYHKEEYVTHT